MYAFFFFNDTATTEIYPLSLHDALPIWVVTGTEPAASTFAVSLRLRRCAERSARSSPSPPRYTICFTPARAASRSEQHTSELQSRQYLVCRLLLEKKNK